MIERQYKDIKLRVYNDFGDFEIAEEAKFEFTDSEGNPVKVDVATLNTSKAESRGHFEDDTQYKPNGYYWMVEPDTRTIQCIVLEKKTSINFLEILKSVGHEHGHLIDVNQYHASEEYHTELGYKQEEEKALMFENFTVDTYKMALLYMDMIEEILGSKLTDNA